MSGNKYLYVHGWRTHQSYRADRGMPPWIKIQRSLLRNRKWLSLSDEQKGQLISMWLLAADNDGRIPNDAQILQKACALENEIDLNTFISLGLLDAKMPRATPQVDAKMTPRRRQLDAPEAETETEAEEEKKDSVADATGADAPPPADKPPSSTLLDLEDVEAVKKAAFEIATAVGRRSAPQELAKLGMSWAEIHAVLVTARTKVDATSYIAAVIRGRTGPPQGKPVHNNRGVILDKPRPVRPHT